MPSWTPTIAGVLVTIGLKYMYGWGTYRAVVVGLLVAIFLVLQGVYWSLETEQGERRHYRMVQLGRNR
jgi:hypothetical protein